MKKFLCERICAAVLAVTIPAELIAVLAMEDSGAAWAMWLGVGCALLQLTAMAAGGLCQRQSPSRFCGDAAKLAVKAACRREVRK